LSVKKTAPDNVMNPKAVNARTLHTQQERVKGGQRFYPEWSTHPPHRMMIWKSQGSFPTSCATSVTSSNNAFSSLSLTRNKPTQRQKPISIASMMSPMGSQTTLYHSATNSHNTKETIQFPLSKPMQRCLRTEHTPVCDSRSKSVSKKCKKKAHTHNKSRVWITTQVHQYYKSTQQCTQYIANHKYG